MRTFVGYVIAALVLAGGGEAFRRASEVQARLAAAEEQLATLAPEAAEAEFSGVEASLGLAGRTPVVGPALLADVQEQRAAAAYWRGDYSALPSEETELASDDLDADVVFLAANAAFRTALTRKTVQDVLKDMDRVIRTYTLLLKKDASHVDGAYNFEYAVRVRNALAKLRPNAANAFSMEAKKEPPSRPNVHGEEGAPPENTPQQEFQVIVPLRPDERGDQMKAGTGAPRIRRG